MKNILTKIEFHYSYIIMAFSFILAGYFKNLIILTVIIIIHEFGHCLCGLLLKEKATKIIIYPFGGRSIFDIKINTNINKELLISIFGLIFQIIFFMLISYLNNISIINSNNYQIFSKYHYGMLFFNILPMYPLDGFKIINLFLYKFFSFKTANNLIKIINILSIILIIYIFFPILDYSYMVMITLMISNFIIFLKEDKYLFYKFLMERYLYNFPFKKVTIINNISKMKKDFRHIFKTNNNYETERIKLKKMFDTKGIL